MFSLKVTLVILNTTVYITNSMINFYKHPFFHTQEKSVEHSAGGTMLAVRKKLTDINKSIDLLSALKELREFRKSTNKAKGMCTVPF